MPFLFLKNRHALFIRRQEVRKYLYQEQDNRWNHIPQKKQKITILQAYQVITTKDKNFCKENYLVIQILWAFIQMKIIQLTRIYV